jgi:hypothetical protein
LKKDTDGDGFNDKVDRFPLDPALTGRPGQLNRAGQRSWTTR